MKNNANETLDYCPLCQKSLGTTDPVPRWCHDIMEHRKYFEMQCENMTTPQMRRIMYEIVEYFYRPSLEDN